MTKRIAQMQQETIMELPYEHSVLGDNHFDPISSTSMARFGTSMNEN